MPVARAVLTRNVVGQLQMGPVAWAKACSGIRGKARQPSRGHCMPSIAVDNIDAFMANRVGPTPKRLHAPVAATMRTMMPAAGPPLAMAVGSSLQPWLSAKPLSMRLCSRSYLLPHAASLGHGAPAACFVPLLPHEHHNHQYLQAEQGRMGEMLLRPGASQIRQHART